MQIKLALNKDREVIWSLPQTKTYLTIEEPEAIFEVENLSEIQKLAIVSSLRNRKILSETKPEELIPNKPVVAASVQPIVSQPKIEIPAVLQQDGIAKELLKKSVSDIKKDVLVTKDLRLLRLLISHEEKHSKRVTILKAIREQIAYLMEEVAKSIQTEHIPVPLADPARMNIKGTTVSYDVIESDQESITLNIEKY